MSLQISVENVSALGRRLTVAVESQKVETAIKERLDKLKQKIKIDGFRPGKVPTHVIKMRYGKAVRDEVVQELMRSSLAEAFDEQKIKPASMPNIELTSSEEGKPLEFVADFDIFPEIEFADLSNLEIEKGTGEISELDVEKTLKSLAKQHSDYQESDAAAKQDDKITIDFLGKLDGEPFEGGEAKSFDLVLGSKNMIPGFEEALIGMSKGDEKVISVTFPEDYHAKDLAGKETTFDIKVHQVQTPVVPNIDDEFAKKLGVEGVVQLRQEVKQNLDRELKNHLQAALKEQVMDKLLALHDIEVPESLVKQEVVQLQKQAIQNLQQYIQQGQNNPELLQSDKFSKEHFEKDARKRVTLGILLSDLIEKHEIKLDDEKLKAKVKEISAMYMEPAEAERHFFQDEKRLSELQGVVMEEQLVDFILESANITEKKVTYSQIMDEKENK